MANTRDNFTGWRKAGRSNTGNECVEVGQAPGVVGVADTKQYAVGPILEFSVAAWGTFMAETRSGKHDRP